MPVNVRYHAKTDTYYFQIQGEQWHRLNNKIRHISTRLKYIQAKQYEEERIMLEEKRRRLLQERRKSERYVKISAADVPDNVPARPIHELPGQVVTAEPEWYAQLLGRLQRTRSGEAEDCEAPQVTKAASL